MDKSICHSCHQLKVRMQDGYFGMSKNKRFIDENGKLWNGRKCCPDCHKNKSRVTMKTSRFQKLIEDTE